MGAVLHREVLTTNHIVLIVFKDDHGNVGIPERTTYTDFIKRNQLLDEEGLLEYGEWVEVTLQ